MADNPYLDNQAFSDIDAANSTYDSVREGYDQAFQNSTQSANEFAKYWPQDQNRYRTAIGSNGLGAQAAYRDAWEKTNPGYKASADAYNRSMDAAGAASGSQFSSGNAIQRSVGMTDLGNRLFREHQADLGGMYGQSQQAEAGRVSNLNQFLTNLYPSLESWLGNTQISVDNANTNYQNQQALQNQQLAQAEQNSNTSFWGSLLSGGIGLIGSLFCSEAMKENLSPVPKPEHGKYPFAERIRRLNLFFWNYKDDVANELQDFDTHMSPMAEQWADEFGGNGETISQQDALGVCIGMMQEMDMRIQKLESENARLRMENHK